MHGNHWLVFAVLLGSACSSDGKSTSVDLVAQLGFSELAVTAPLAPDGFVDFYMGEQVLREFAETGGYLPAESKPFSRIRFPARTVADAQAQASPIVVSLCDAASDVSLVSHVVGDNFQPLAGDVENCSPWVEYGRGTMTIEYRSGQPGVYGAASVGIRENGSFFAGASMQGALPSACEGDQEAVIASAMYLGSARPSLDDGCRPPGQPEPNP